MAFGTNCLRRRKVLFLLFADLGYNQGNKQEQYALRKTERLEIIMTKEQITGTLAMWRRVKKDEETFKESRNLGTITSMKGFVTNASVVLLLYIIVISIKHSAIERLRFLLQGRMNDWVRLNTTRYIRLYFLKEIFSWT